MFAFVKFRKIDEVGFSATLIRQIGIDALENKVTKKFYFFLVQLLSFINLPK